jgi:hypothetical protein
MSEKAMIVTRKPEPKRKNSVSRTRKTGFSQTTRSQVDHILFLQRTIGNQAVQRLIRKCQRTDCTERLQRETRQPFDEEEGLIEGESVQAKESPGHIPEMTTDIEPQIDTLNSGGKPLSRSIRAFMEPHFGRDFSGVQIHTHNQAAKIAESVNARAFTLGQNIVFGFGQYMPATETGLKMLAHELTHVVQQGKAPSGFKVTSGVRNALSLSMDRNMIRRVIWHPNTDTGRDSYPWGSGPRGDILNARTDAGSPIDIWRPHDRNTYWCHGFTFGGSTAQGGPYSNWGQTVPKVLSDDGWKRGHSCMARESDIMVFYDSSGMVAHSGIIRSVFAPNGCVDETLSRLESKWGQGARNRESWLTNTNQYGGYRCFSKNPAYGPCSCYSLNELP